MKLEIEPISSLIDLKKLILKSPILDHKTGDKMTNLFELEVLINIQQRHFLEIKEDSRLLAVKNGLRFLKKSTFFLYKS
jgi:hypothetical protein